MWNIIVVIAIILCIVIVYILTKDSKFVKYERGQVFDIKNSIDLTGVPVIVLYQDGERFNFMLDTGSNVSYINKASKLKVSNPIGKDNFVSASGDGNDCTVHVVKLSYDKKSFELPVRVADLSNSFDAVKQSFGVSLDGLLGGDFLSKYSYVLDYAEYVVYSRQI